MKNLYKKLILIALLTIIIVIIIYSLYCNFYIFKLKNLGFEKQSNENLITYVWGFKAKKEDTSTPIKITYIPFAYNSSVNFEYLYNLYNHKENNSLVIEFKEPDGYNYYYFYNINSEISCNQKYEEISEPCPNNIDIEYDFDIDNTSINQLSSISKYIEQKYNYKINFNNIV